MFLALFDLRFNPLRIRLRSDLLIRMEEMLNKPHWWVISLSFIIVLFGGLYSDDTVYWVTRLRIKLPFLLAPFVFYLLPPIGDKTYERIHLILIAVMMVSTLPVLFEILTHFQSTMDELRNGQPIETPGSHIRYSLLLTLSCISCFILWTKRHSYSERISYKILPYVGIYLFTFVHILAVRSGIAALYITIFIFAVRMLFDQKLKKVALILTILLILSPIIAYKFVPTFSNRIQYMIRDVSQFQKAEWNDYSDAERLLSINAGIEIAKTSPWYGIGPGDLKKAMQRFFLVEYDKDTFLLPHNQFVSIFAGSGLVGLVLFLTALLVPLLMYRHYENPFFLALNIIVCLSLLVENTLETSVGVALYVFFLLIGLNHLRQSEPVP